MVTHPGLLVLLLIFSPNNLRLTAFAYPDRKLDRTANIFQVRNNIQTISTEMV